MLRRSAAVALLASTTLLACSSSSPSPSPSPASTSGTTGGSSGASGSTSGSPAPRCATDAPRYLAFLSAGSCSDVPGTGGAWVSHSTFPDAPAPIRDVACAYQWAPAATALPDVDALAAIGAEHLTRSVAATPSCDAPPLSPGSLPLAPVASSTGPNGESAPTGVTGCDVCGRVFEQSVYVILPDDELDLHTIVVTTESGQYLSFDVQQPQGRAQVFSGQLPPAPNNGTYKQGKIVLLEAAF